MPTHNQIIYDKNSNLHPAGLTRLGAYFPIEVHVPPQIAEALTKQGMPVPTPASGVRLIDTGASITCVDEKILTGLSLNPIGVVETGTANGPVQQNVYPGRIVFPTKGWTIDLERVVGVNLAGQSVEAVLEAPAIPIIALLGRNFLEQCVFIYNGTMGSWTISMA